MENLLNFFVVIAVQLIFFLIHAHFAGEFRNVKKYLLWGMLLGLPFGILCDLFLIKVLFIHDYKFELSWWFLTINGLFSYGFMIANVFLLKNYSFRKVYLWSIAIGLVYELTNYFFQVWYWTFHQIAPYEYLAVIFSLYFWLTVVMMSTLRFVFRQPFKLLPF